MYVTGSVSSAVHAGDALLEGSQEAVSSAVPDTFQQSLDANASGVGDWQVTSTACFLQVHPAGRGSTAGASLRIHSYVWHGHCVGMQYP